MSAAFAENGECWFIICWFDFDDKSTNEQKYVKHQQKVKSVFMNQLEKEISSLKEAKKTISDAEKSDIIPQMSSVKEGLDERIDLYQEILDTEWDMKNNPGKYLSKQKLVERAMNYYKVKPNGEPCDDDRRWVEDTCIPMKRAHKLFHSWDLEWLRDHPELDTRRGA